MLFTNYYCNIRGGKARSPGSYRTSMCQRICFPSLGIFSCLVSILLSGRCAHGTPLVYEGFRLSLADGVSIVGQGSGTGFTPQSAWNLTETPENRTVGSARFRAQGLFYTDSTGRQLVTEPGAVELQAADLDNIFSRPLVQPITVRPGDYWVSYLLRWNGGVNGPPPFQPGSLFWTPDGEWDRGAVGLPPSNLATGTLGFINGQATSVSIQPLETHLVVVRISRGEMGILANAIHDFAQMWVDPPLVAPGMPHAEYHGTKLLDSIRDANAWRIKFNHFGQATYTLDEFRLGNSFADVAPIAPSIPCDLNHDGRADGADVAILFGNWAKSGNEAAIGDCHIDGIVDSADLAVLFSNWTGDSAPTDDLGLTNEPTFAARAMIPEPKPEALRLVYLVLALCMVRGGAD